MDGNSAADMGTVCDGSTPEWNGRGSCNADGIAGDEHKRRVGPWLGAVCERAGAGEEPATQGGAGEYHGEQPAGSAAEMPTRVRVLAVPCNSPGEACGSTATGREAQLVSGKPGRRARWTAHAQARRGSDICE